MIQWEDTPRREQMGYQTEDDNSDEAGDVPGDKDRERRRARECGEIIRDQSARQTAEEEKRKGGGRVSNKPEVEDAEWEDTFEILRKKLFSVETQSQQNEKSPENITTDAAGGHYYNGEADELRETPHQGVSSENADKSETSEHSEECGKTRYHYHEGASLLLKEPAKPKEYDSALRRDEGRERRSGFSGRPEEKEIPTPAADEVKKLEAEGHCGARETLNGGHEGTQKRKKQESCRHEQPRKNHRKSTSPNHFADYRRTVAQWFSHKDTDKNLAEDREEVLGEDPEKRTGGEDTEAEVVSEDEDLLRFAEILYKCSLCSTLPCILTSQSAFLSHVREHHLAARPSAIQCQFCHLLFHTNTDLQVHLSESHPDALRENQETISVVPGEATNQADQGPLTGLENEHPGRQPTNRDDDKIEREQLLGRDWDDQGRFAGRNVIDAQQRRVDGEAESKPNGSGFASHVKHDAKQGSSSSPALATLEYHSSQHLDQLQMLADHAAMSSPLQQQAAADKARLSPLFGGGPAEGINGFPSFTPEFGRFTKLIREGGKIVYFCQVCNVKCQVKAAFQVHCNGLRHHNKVNLAGKSKAAQRGTSPDCPPRDPNPNPNPRTPLREVAVAGPQVTSATGDDDCFVDKMTKFFQDHPDVSAMLNGSRGGPNNVSHFVAGPPAVDFSGLGGDRHPQDPDSKPGSAATKLLRASSAGSPDKDCPYDRTRYTENSCVSFSPQQRREFKPQKQPSPHGPRDSREGEGRQGAEAPGCWAGTAWPRYGRKKPGEWTAVGQNRDDDDVHAGVEPRGLTRGSGRKRRAAPLTALLRGGKSPTLPDFSQSPSSRTRPSSASSAASSAAGNGVFLVKDEGSGDSRCSDFEAVSGCGGRGGSQEPPSESKRARAVDGNNGPGPWGATRDVTATDPNHSDAGFHGEFSRTATLSHGDPFMTPKPKTNPSPSHSGPTAKTDGCTLRLVLVTEGERGEKCSDVDERCTDHATPRGTKCDSTTITTTAASVETRRTPPAYATASPSAGRQDSATIHTKDSTDPRLVYRCDEQGRHTAAVPLADTGHRGLPVSDPHGAHFGSAAGIFSDGWFRDARAVVVVKEELQPWVDVDGGGLDGLEDVTTEMSLKGPNNEGWKVAKIRDVLRGKVCV